MLGSPLPSNFDMDRVGKRQYELRCMYGWDGVYGFGVEDMGEGGAERYWWGRGYSIFFQMTG